MWKNVKKTSQNVTEFCIFGNVWTLCNFWGCCIRLAKDVLNVLPTSVKKKTLCTNGLCANFKGPHWPTPNRKWWIFTWPWSFAALKQPFLGHLSSQKSKWNFKKKAKQPKEKKCSHPVSQQPKVLFYTAIPLEKVNEKITTQLPI